MRGGKEKEVIKGERKRERGGRESRRHRRWEVNSIGHIVKLFPETLPSPLKCIHSCSSCTCIYAPNGCGLDTVSHGNQVVSMPHVLWFFRNEHHLPGVGSV